MPIRTREQSNEPVQTSARKFEPSSDAVLETFPDPKRAATILYDQVPTKTIPTEDLATLVRTVDNDADIDRVYRNRIKSRMTAIRAFCVFCAGGSPKAVRMCTSMTCPLFPFRMGNNPFNRKV